MWVFLRPKEYTKQRLPYEALKSGSFLQIPLCIPRPGCTSLGCRNLLILFINGKFAADISAAPLLSYPPICLYAIKCIRWVLPIRHRLQCCPAAITYIRKLPIYILLLFSWQVASLAGWKSSLLWHNPSINWISSIIGTSTVMYFSPLFSLYVLAWDCPKKNAIYFNIQFAWKIKMGFHTLPKYRHTREQKYFTSLRTAVPAELIGTLSWIKNGNDYLLSACGIFMMIHTLQKLIYFANQQIDKHNKTATRTHR